MFTGLIEAIGTLEAAQPRGEGRVLVIAAPTLAEHLRLGDSIAIDGCCLTVESAGGRSFQVFASPETLARTTLGLREAGSLVNLERPLAFGDRLGGHLVTGHVDSLGVVERYDPLGESWLLTVTFPSVLARLLVEKGSIAVDGISLTTFDVTESTFSAAIIPETHARTSLQARRAGDAVNLEADLLGKYVARQLALRENASPGGVTEELLQRAGFLDR